MPLYGLESLVGRDLPVNHPEFYYGFVATALAWQLAFLLISRDPVRFAPLIPAAIVEKSAYVVAMAVLWGMGRVPASVLPFAGIDAAWVILFTTSYKRVI